MMDWPFDIVAVADGLVAKYAPRKDGCAYQV
jgi:hypothetical protein